MAGQVDRQEAHFLRQQRQQPIERPTVIEPTVQANDWSYILRTVPLARYFTVWNWDLDFRCLKDRATHNTRAHTITHITNTRLETGFHGLAGVVLAY